MTQPRFKHSYHPCRVSTAMTEGVIPALVPKQLTFRCKRFTSRYLYQVSEFLKLANRKSFFSLASLDVFDLQITEKKTPTNKQENLKYHWFLQTHLEAESDCNIGSSSSSGKPALTTTKTLKVIGKLFLERSCLLTIVINSAE